MKNVLIFYFLLLVPINLYALMPIEKEQAESQEEVVSVQGAAKDKMSEEEIIAIEEKIKEDIEKIKEEKRRIIEKAKRREYPKPRRPFEVIKIPSKPRPRELEPIEKYNVLLGEKPIILILALLVLSLVSYLLYRVILREGRK